MRNARGLGVLAVPAAVSLAGVLVIACMEGSPTAPDGASTPSLAKTKTPLYDDPKGDGVCRGNDLVVHENDEFWAPLIDGNGNLVICLKSTGPGPKK